MKLSTKVRYGFRFMINLALNYNHRLVQVKEVADKEHISPKYLEQIAASFKTAGLVKVSRGAKGGYCLIQPPEEITLLDVFRAVEGEIRLTECSDASASCPNGEECMMNSLWKGLNRNMEEYLIQRTLADVICLKKC